MNKNLKRIVSLTLAVSAITALEPTKYINLFTTEAHAADKTELTSIKVKASSSIKLYESSKYKSSEKVNDDELEKGETYYGKSSKDSVKITTSDGDYVRIFKGSKGYADGKSIPLSDGTTTLKVRLYSDKTDSDTKSGDDYEAEYTIKIKYTGDDKEDDEEDEDYDDIYLDDMTITSSGDDIDFKFKKKTSSYDISVPESVSSVKIKATPEDEDEDTVKIDGSTVDDDDKYKKEVDLKKGANEILVKVKNDDGDSRTYTLNITRGGSSSSNSNNNSNSNSNNNSSSTVKVNQWVTNNGKWNYVDGAGNVLKNTWFYDRNYGKNYYLQADGTMATGWFLNNSKWYYLDGSGAMQTGWQNVGGTWYYLDASGIMQTGWFKDVDQRFYYLQSNGAMATNTTIGGYKLGSNGAWIR